MNPPLQILSLFSGAGGLDLGFAYSGFETVLALDSCPHAIRTYNRNFPEGIAKQIDLTDLAPSEFLNLIPRDANPVGIIGGPPCQGFSLGNVHKRRQDKRNLLPFKYAEFLAAAREKYALDFFVFENVIGLARPRHKRRFSEILRSLRKAGFHVWHEELDALDYGVPQRRRRLFIVGLNADTYPDAEFQFPQVRKKQVTVRSVIEGFPPPVFYKKGLSERSIPFHPNHWTMQPKSKKFSSPGASQGRSFKKLSWNEPSPTVAYGNREIHVHPTGDRRLSILEAMLLQGFPPEFEMEGTLSAQVTQVSNAVPPPMAQAIGESVVNILRVANGMKNQSGSSN